MSDSVIRVVSLDGDRGVGVALSVDKLGAAVVAGAVLFVTRVSVDNLGAVGITGMVLSVTGVSVDTLGTAVVVDVCNVERRVGF